MRRPAHQVEHAPIAICPRCETVYNLTVPGAASGAMSIPAETAIRGFEGYDPQAFVDGVYDKMLRRILIPGCRVLDIGCFDGRFLAFVREKGGEPIGIEMQGEMATFCRQQGLRVYAGRIPDEMPADLCDASFDLITAIESTGYWRDWNGCMSTIFRLLKPGGHLMIKLNQGTSRYYDGTISYAERLGGFHAMLNLRALGIIGERHGFCIESYRPLAYIFDRRRYHPTPPLRLLYRNWLRLKSIWAAKFWRVEDWDKIVVLFRRTGDVA